MPRNARLAACISERMLRRPLDRSVALASVPALLLVFGGCGLVLDASSTRDAAVAADARGMDAQTESDAEIPDARGMDAAEPPELDAAEPPELDAAHPPELDATGALDADEPEPDAALGRPEAGPGDANVGPVLRDAGQDAHVVAARDSGLPDAALPDAALPDASVPDASLRDAGRDAGRPDANADAACFCNPIATSGNMCQDQMCEGSACVYTGPAFTCPPAGSCVRPCARGASGGAVCVREGTACSPLLQACDTDTMCIGGTGGGARCEAYSSCPVRVCLPTCSTTGGACMFMSEGATVRGACTDGVCVPTSFLPAWCS